MCCVAFVASTSASKRIAGRARSPFSHGFGGANAAQPASARAPEITATRTMRPGSLVRGEQCTNPRLERRGAIVVEPLLDGDDDAVAIDQVRARHAFHV